MKKLIICIVSMLFLSASAQNNVTKDMLIVDETDVNIISFDELSKTHKVVSENSEGEYVVLSDYGKMADDWSLQLSVGAQGSAPIYYMLNVRYSWPEGISEGSPMLIKLGNGEVVESKSSNTSENIYGEYYTDKKWYCSIYPLTKEDVSKIAQYGIFKIRLSKGTKFYDKDVPSETSRFLSESVVFLRRYLKNTPSIYDDF